MSQDEHFSREEIDSILLKTESGLSKKELFKIARAISRMIDAMHFGDTAGENAALRNLEAMSDQIPALSAALGLLADRYLVNLEKKGIVRNPAKKKRRRISNIVPAVEYQPPTENLPIPTAEIDLLPSTEGKALSSHARSGFDTLEHAYFHLMDDCDELVMNDEGTFGINARIQPAKDLVREKMIEILTEARLY